MADSINTPENRERFRRCYVARRTLVTTIHWTPLDERLPAYGQTVVVWLGLLGITVRAYRDARDRNQLAVRRLLAENDLVEVV